MGGLHSTHLDLSVAARWSTRWLALVSVGGWAAEYFTPSIRPYLVLFSCAALGLAGHGGGGLYFIFRARRRRPAPASAQRGSWITSSIELRRQVQKEGE